jgi:hypothetical protein
MFNVKFVCYSFIYMTKILQYAIDFVGKFQSVTIKTCLNFIFYSEVLCQEALQLTIGNNLLWSVSRDTQEGVEGKFSIFSTLSLLFEHEIV